MKLNYQTVLLGAVSSATVFSGFLLASSNISADDSIVSDVSISVPVSCSVTGTLDTAHTATVNNGTYQEDIGTTTFKVVCNDNSGYSIYAVGYSNEEFGNTKMLATIGGVLTPASDFNTGLNTSGNTSAWAMKIIPVTTASSGTTQPYTPTIESDTNGTFSNCHIVPSTYTKVATFASSTDFTIGSSIQSTYRAFISSNQLAGNYNGKVRYTLVHPASEVPTQPVVCDPDYICYNPNASGVVDSMGDQRIVIPSATTIDLWASNFQRPGYGFAGWSDKYDWVINENDANGNGTGPNAGYHIYGPNETISFTAGQYSNPNSGLALYAVWVPSAGDLQTFTCPDNSTMPIGRVTALKDQRDNNVYTVAKLADSKCWMTENLRLDNDAAHNSDGVLARGYNSSFIGLADPETANFSSSTANSLYSTDGSTAAPAITGYNTSYRFPRYNNQNTNDPATNMTAWDHNSNTYSAGNYYTWPAAIADTSKYSTRNQSVIITSLCPTGWSLPKGGDKSNEANNDFWLLIVDGINEGIKPANYDSSTWPYFTNTNDETEVINKLRGYPNNFIYSGRFVGSSASSRGHDGYYWADAVQNEIYSFTLSISGGAVYPGNEDDYKNYGLSIRCTQ